MLHKISVVVAAAFVVASVSAVTCPPPGFNTEGAINGGFDVNWYANGTWFVQQQMPISYLPVGFTYCVSATYTLKTTKPWNYDVAVLNAAENSSGQTPKGPKGICGKVVNATEGKLEVAPCFLPPILSGPYWVVDFSVEDGWALVSGGPPKIESNGACKTGTGTNDSGLWIFTRMQRRNQVVVDNIRTLAQKKGFDVSVLADVNQTGCKGF